MEALQKSIQDLNAVVATLNKTVEALAPLVPHAADLAALPATMKSVQESLKNTDEKMQDIDAVIQTLDGKNPGSTSTGAEQQKGAGVLGAKPDPSASSNVPKFHHQRHENNSRNQKRLDTEERFPTRVLKLDFPTYDGTGDPLAWLNRCELYFRGQNTPEERRVWLATLHITDATQLWYYRLETTGGEPSWCRFVQLVHRRFGPPMTESLLGEIAMLRRSGFVQDYTNQFVSLACRDVELTETQQIQLFIAGLTNPLKTDVALQRPVTLDDAIMLARAFEQRLALDIVPNRSASRAPYRPTLSATSTATVAASGQSSTQSAPGSAKLVPVSSSLPRRRLTLAEMAQRRADGLCYNCDEKFVQGHCCKRLFILEVCPEDEFPEALALETSEEPEISLHALTGIHSKGCRTMKVLVYIGGNRLTALLDSGSSHNFVDTEVARYLQLPFQRREGLHVTVGNGDHIGSPGLLPSMTIMIGSEYFKIDSYVLPLGSYDMILGVQWLGSLGPIL
uniref:Retrotransposon gag domain-containing protein n=1 Tax=Arundo donax TaxID=35708 RepID=A0A0A9GMD0_ARUDO